MNLVTSKGEEILRINDDLSNIIIFTYRENLKFFEIFRHHIRWWNIFILCNVFEQFFIIHGLIDDFYVPLVFCISNNKFTDTYEQALSFIKDKAMENFNLTFNPKYINKNIFS